MGALADLLKRTPPVVWLDAGDYAARLLSGGTAPWLDVAACVAWQRKGQGLLRSDVLSLPLAAVAAQWLQAHGALREQMASKSRLTFALKTLLADEALRAHSVELARGLRAGLAGAPLALVLPSPRAWVALAHAQAHGREVEVSEDEADTAAVYIADLLRAFGETGIDALLIEEGAHLAPASAAELACYQPILNVAAHFRWDIGLHLADASRYAGGIDGYTFGIAPQAPAGAAWGIAAAPAFWAGGPPPAAQLRYARIPADAQPEAVLERLAALR